AVAIGALSQGSTACRSTTTDSGAKKSAATAPTAIGGGPPSSSRAEGGDMFVEHFARTLSMRDAVIHGELEKARHDARALAAHDIPQNFPERWKPFIDELRAGAKAGAEADTLERAGVAVARIASTCGDCHRVLGGPTFDVGEPPKATEGTKAQMARHAWGIDRLWLGLIQPSDAAWKKGSEVLATAPLGPGHEADAQSTEVLAQRVHALGELGQTLVGQAVPPAPANAPRRIDTYGQLVSTCAACHTSGVKSE
ncbi:MAG: hypothetical protein ACXWP4_09425, partial [Polyangiales bacterium]